MTMRQFIVKVDTTPFNTEVTEDNLREALYHGMPIEHTVREISELNHRSDGTPRMTFAQREKLWQLCGGYNVPFREDDYFTESTGFVMGWIGGFNHSGLPSAKEKKTIYIAVEPNGDAHS